ncbi:MAG: class I SAM-dependent methyltransferase [Thermomicrobiales bacterium]
MKREEFEQMYRAEDRLWWYLALRRQVIAALGLERAPLAGGKQLPRILDAGCGTGGMAARLRPYGQVFGIDLAPYAVAVCREGRGLRETAVASITELPFTDNSFDYAVSLDVISDAGTGNDALAVAELARVLRPGGRACLNLPAYRWLAGEHDVAVETKRRYTRGEVRELLTASGFVIERITYWNCALLPLVAASRAASRLRGRAVNAARSDVTVPAAPINATLGTIARLEGEVLRRVDLPTGSSLLAVARKP